MSPRIEDTLQSVSDGHTARQMLALRAASGDGLPQVSRSRLSRQEAAKSAASGPLWPSKTARRWASVCPAMGEATTSRSSILSSPLDPAVAKLPVVTFIQGLLLSCCFSGACCWPSAASSHRTYEAQHLLLRNRARLTGLAAWQQPAGPQYQSSSTALQVANGTHSVIRAACCRKMAHPSEWPSRCRLRASCRQSCSLTAAVCCGG